MSVDVRAAGAVLWRRAGDGFEVALVHRPRYDDWSLPKGKVDPGETIAATAVREIAEETGFRAVLGRYVAQTTYEVPAKNNGRPLRKSVDYFSAEAVSGAFEPNHEVDELRWLDPIAAERLLTRPADVRVLREFCALPPAQTTVLLVRHAKAGKREDWTGDDDLRPLSEAGQRQAAALRDLLPLFGPDRVYSAPRLRCVQTVGGIAESLGVEVQHEPLLSEEGYWPDPLLGIRRLLAIAADGGTPLISSQGGVIPDLVSALADRDGLELPAARDGVVPSKKGSLWVLSFCPGDDGPVLVSADYYPSPLPAPVPSAG
ncbi:8-oxo-dGTP diphosphatase [Amycolatopsis echigonensis]|uniref:8-oxo-dGTP diphosphatase n=1 Tax=Amycolatopsis echigonensis TaxID=2576905 RepID=A0A2N3WBD9_9PSEU|nr:NUDIX hydrolase [Amycolatopsis niigatensis]PKV91195.1 8-oxo-dGTP diphosphatase [Amycolatopsis niigatensis]